MESRIQTRFFISISATIISLFLSISLSISLSPFRISFVEEVLSQTKIQPSGQTNSTREGKKTGGIVGDPSRKRGFDLGYDAGPRAGNEDKAQNRDPDPSARPEYMNPEQFYRYEYGNRALFIEGYRHGFFRGYQISFGKKEFKRAETSEKTASVASPHFRKILIENVKTRGPLSKKIFLAEDAL